MSPQHSFAKARWLAFPLIALFLLACNLSSLLGEAPTAVPTEPQQPTALAQRTPTARPTAAAKANIITNAVTSKDVKADTFDPVGITDEYPADQKVLHAVVTVSSAPSGTVLKAVWTAVDVGSAAAPNTEIDEKELNVDGSRNVDFTLTPSGNKWPAGSYKVDIYLNGDLNRTLKFTVAAGTASKTLTPSGAKGSGLIKSVTMAQDVKGDTKEPVNPTILFQPTSVVHAVVAVQDAPSNTKFTAAWYVTDVGGVAAPDTLIDKTDLTTSGTRNLDFSLSPSTKWPAGSYRVEISINDQLSQTVNYTVK